jgi:hypothetical protein
MSDVYGDKQNYKKKKKAVGRQPSPQLPPPPRFVPVESADTSRAEAVRKMTSDDHQAVMVLSNIDHSDVARLSVLESLEKDFQLKWLEVYIHSELSLSPAIEGKRSEQLTEITKEPVPVVEDSGGVLGRIKERFKI